MKWVELGGKVRLSPHMQFEEYCPSNFKQYLDVKKCKPEWILAVATVFEMARERYNDILDGLDMPENDPRRGIRVSSGLRTPKTNRGASRSIHMVNNGIAMDFKPIGGFDKIPISYDKFYGCFVWALSKLSDHFGLGYYDRSRSGIHIDSAFVARKRLNDQYNHPFNGHRWGQNYSWIGNEKKLTGLNETYSDNGDQKTWQEWASLMGVNLELIKQMED